MDFFLAGEFLISYLSQINMTIFISHLENYWMICQKFKVDLVCKEKQYSSVGMDT